MCSRKAAHFSNVAWQCKAISYALKESKKAVHIYLCVESCTFRKIKAFATLLVPLLQLREIFSECSFLEILRSPTISSRVTSSLRTAVLPSLSLSGAAERPITSSSCLQLAKCPRALSNDAQQRYARAWFRTGKEAACGLAETDRLRSPACAQRGRRLWCVNRYQV